MATLNIYIKTVSVHVHEKFKQDFIKIFVWIGLQAVPRSQLASIPNTDAREDEVGRKLVR